MSRICIEDLYPPAEKCRCCGQCCSAFTVRKTREEIADLAARDEARGLNMLQSDAVFLYRHGIPLTAEEARRRSPSITGSPGWPNETYWSCEFLRGGKKCQLDLNSKPKPKVCKGYPWYSSRPRAGIRLRPGCGYHI
jgi:Fe-S-cluster containining protein